MIENQIVYHRAYKYGIVVSINAYRIPTIYFPSIKEKKTIDLEEVKLNIINQPIRLMVPDLANLGMLDFLFEKQDINQAYQLYTSKQLKFSKKQLRCFVSFYSDVDLHHIKIEIDKDNIVHITKDNKTFAPDKYLYCFLLMLKNNYLLPTAVKNDSMFDKTKMITSMSQNITAINKKEKLSNIENSIFYPLLTDLRSIKSYAIKYHTIHQKIQEIGKNIKEFKFFFNNLKEFKRAFQPALVNLVSNCLECLATYREANDIKYSRYNYNPKSNYSYFSYYDIKYKLLHAYINDVSDSNFNGLVGTIIDYSVSFRDSEKGLLSNIYNKINISFLLKLYDLYHFDLVYVKGDKNFLDSNYDLAPEFISETLGYIPEFNQEEFHKNLESENPSIEDLAKQFSRASVENLLQEDPKLVLKNMFKLKEQSKISFSTIDKVIDALPHNQFLKLLFTDKNLPHIKEHTYRRPQSWYSSNYYDPYGNSSYLYDDEDEEYEDFDDYDDDESLPF